MSADWARVKWSTARQVTEILGWEAQADDVSPASFYAALRAAGRGVEAVEFMSQALPRWEAVAWAVQGLRTFGPGDGDGSAAALAAAAHWVDDPSEAARRAALAAAEVAPPAAPERLAALAAYFSGGSIAPEDCEPLAAPREAAGQCASAALLVAALGSEGADAALSRILDLGERLATGLSEGGAR